MSNVTNVIGSTCEDRWTWKNATIHPKASLPGVSLCLWLILPEANTVFSLVSLKDSHWGPLIGCELQCLQPGWAEIKVSFTLRFSYQSLLGSGITQTEGVNLQPGLFFSDILHLKMISKGKNQLWESAQVKWWATCRQPAGTERETVRNY